MAKQSCNICTIENIFPTLNVTFYYEPGKGKERNLSNKKNVHSAQHPSISATSLLRMCGRQLTLFSYFESKLPYMKQKRNMNSIWWLERNDLFSF